MSATLDLSCPNCKKLIKVPTEFVGRQIRCKSCQTVFEVQNPATAKPARPVPARPATAARPTAARPAPPPVPEAPLPFKEEEEDDPKNPKPYSVKHDDLDVPRCPFCAKELDPPDTKVCLNCGYNLLDRKRSEARVVYEHTTGDYILHLLPAILSVIGIILIASISIWMMLSMRGWMIQSIFDKEEKSFATQSEQFIVPPYCFNIWIGVFAVAISYYLGRFAFRRFVFNWRPPDVVKSKED